MGFFKTNKTMKIAIILCIVVIVLVGGGFAINSILSDSEPDYNNDEDTKDTREILTDLRLRMKDLDIVPAAIQAYIIPSNDAHQSEYIGRRDRRISYVSGFTGSNGLVVVTEDKAALWTDSRYHLQAEMQLDLEVWTLMKNGLAETPSKEDWLKQVLPPNSKVGTDPFLFQSSEFNALSAVLEASGHELIGITKNLVDLVWPNRPELVLGEIVPHQFKYTGEYIVDKIIRIRDELKKNNAKSTIIPALDEIAWTLNLRGTDIQNNPVFYAYLIITETKIKFFVEQSTQIRVTKDIKDHFEYEGVQVDVEQYDTILDGIQALIDENDDKILISTAVGAAIYNMIPKNRIVQINSPIQLMKAVKTSVEAQGMIDCNVRDGVAVVKYFYWLENNIDKISITELSGAAQLKVFRGQDDKNMGTSFTSISASGSNAAIIHYSPSEETDAAITKNGVYLIDSGGQYLDGTTDITRTIHLGSPTEFQREAFTRVLKGNLAVAHAIFPKRASGSFFDAIARKPLWDAGLDYGHGTGHGLGSYLGVHEYPPLFSSRGENTYNPGMLENMFSSNEPGYYKDGEFGIRIEDTVQVIPANSANDFNGVGALAFNTITLVPFQLKMIKPDILSAEEIRQIDDYHARVLETIGGALRDQRNLDVYNWLEEQTMNISLYYDL